MYIAYLNDLERCRFIFRIIQRRNNSKSTTNEIFKRIKKVMLYTTIALIRRISIFLFIKSVSLIFLVYLSHFTYSKEK